jgi:hypothetical protein
MSIDFTTVAGRSSRPRSPTASRPLPPDAIELPELRGASIEHRLGYFGDDPVVVFGYCPGGGEVIWKDGRSSGFGTGGWRAFLQEFAPLATRHGASLGDLASVGTHVLLMDRVCGAVCAVPRESAEEFLARAYGLPPPTRPCLCALTTDCAACPFRTTCRAGRGGGPVSDGPSNTRAQADGPGKSSRLDAGGRQGSAMSRSRKHVPRGTQRRRADEPVTPRAKAVPRNLTRPPKDAPSRSTPTAQPPLDRVDEASIQSFPCSDPPGYGHA